MTPQKELKIIREKLNLRYKHLRVYSWVKISKYKHLSCNFIIKYKDYLNPLIIVEYQNLSESFIERHKDWLGVHKIEWHQFMSDVFINRMEFKIDEYNNKLFKI